jgi:hypothetical protein
MSKNFALNKLQSSMNKKIAVSIALILLLAMSAAVAILPTVNAQYTYTPAKGDNGLWNLPTFAGITVSPDPVGVGQPVEVIMIIEQLPPSVGRECSTVVFGGWKGMVLTITKPDGTTTTMGPYESDVSGTYQVSYTPDTVGTYYFQFTWPGQTVNGTGYGTYYGNFQASTSPKVALTVQQEPVTGYNEAPIPLPTQYWTEPINAQNRYWNVITGPWLQNGYNSTGASGGFNPYTYAPRSAHIAWTYQPYPPEVGIAGGDYGSLNIGSGQQGGVLVKGFDNPIIIAGNLYFNGPVDASSGTAVSKFYCMNIQTGKILWSAPGSITCGQLLNWRSQQTKAVYPYLWYISGSAYRIYDAYTGALLCQWTSAGGGPIYTGQVVLEKPNPTPVGQTISGSSGGGALLVYFYGRNSGQPNGWLACWNSTLALGWYQMVNQVDVYGTGYNYTGQNPQTWSLPSSTTALNWTKGIQWNVTIPLTSVPSGEGESTLTNWSMYMTDGEYAILLTGLSTPRWTGESFRTFASVRVNNVPSIVAGQEVVPQQGTFAWIKNITQVPYDQTYCGSHNSITQFYLVNGGYLIEQDNPTLSVSAFSESTGDLLWSNSNVYQNDFAMEQFECGTAAYGMLYLPSFDGYLHALNITTGEQVWCSPSRSGGLEIPEPYYPFQVICRIADGVVYATTAKRYEVQPLYRGHLLLAYDAYTGQKLWNISGEMGYWYNPGIVIVDGYLITSNNYDGVTYAFNRGPTATTVTAPMTPVTVGTNVIIQGTVTDQTPTPEAMGTPAISDQWMTPWMEYLYMDQPMPTSATGVNVTIDAVDPNNNFVHIGDATSDITGAYHYTWTPPAIPGTYTIIATFNADNSYYGSYAETAAVVVEAPPATQPPVAQPVPDYTLTIIAAAIAVIIVVIIVGILLLRKKP